MMTAPKEITIKAHDGGSFQAYAAFPKTTPAPAIIIIPSIFGTDEEMKGLVERYAEEGYIALCPEIFWRILPGVLSHTDDVEREKAYDRMKRFDVEKGVDDIGAMVDTLKPMKEYNGKFAVAGFCFGGRYALLAASRLGADAAVSFHGTLMGQNLDDAKKVTCPVSFHFGDNDKSVPVTEVEAIRDALKHNPKAEVFLYAGAAHGFSSPSRPAYNAEVWRVSSERAAKVLGTMK
jgi:carboxymethylenebutenolidase